MSHYQLPYRQQVGKGVIYCLSTKIHVLGCYTTNSNQIAMIGLSGAYTKHTIIVFEEAFEFDEKTILAVKEAIRGSKLSSIELILDC